MTRFFALSSAFVAPLAILGSPALASGYTEPVVEIAPMPIAAPVAIWTGAYAGLSYSRHGSGEMTFANPPTGTFSFIEGSDFGAFGGYTRQYGTWVFGGELAYYNIDQRVTGFATAGLDDMFDLSGRIGHAWGNFQLYGVAGLSMGTYFEMGGASQWSLGGYHVGLGAEYQVSRRFTVGLQYVTRRFSGDNPDGLGQTVSIEHDTVSLRGMFRF